MLVVEPWIPVTGLDSETCSRSASAHEAAHVDLVTGDQRLIDSLSSRGRQLLIPSRIRNQVQILQ